MVLFRDKHGVYELVRVADGRVLRAYHKVRSQERQREAHAETLQAEGLDFGE